MNLAWYHKTIECLTPIWRWFCSVCSAVWEAFCWLIIPAVFGSLLIYSHYIGKDISWMQFILAAVAVSPWLLRLFTGYLSEFSFGPSGVSGKTKQAVANKGEIDKPKLTAESADAPKPQAAEEKFSNLLPQTKKVLRTLWKYQVEHFGPTDIRRWGFSVGTNAPDYRSFSLGLLELINLHLVSVDTRGFAFLTNDGIVFCQKENESVSSYPDYYSHFAN
jgi:hypothetical protein